MVLYSHYSNPSRQKTCVDLSNAHAKRSATESGHDKFPISEHLSIHKQTEVSYSLQVSSVVSLEGLAYEFKRNKSVLCTAQVDDPGETHLPASLREGHFWYLHYPTLARHPGEDDISL